MRKASSPRGYYQVCADQEKVIPTKNYKHANTVLQRNGPDVAVYPWPEQKDVLPIYLNDETPSPWPGLDLTGLPVSIHFNPHRFADSQISILDFQLTNLSDPDTPVEILPVRTEKTDTHHHIFTRFDYAWFPRYALRLESTYQVQLGYTIDNKVYSKTWQFHTKQAPDHRIRLHHCRKLIQVYPDITYAMSLTGELRHTDIKKVQCWRTKGESCQTNFSILGGIDLTVSAPSTLELYLRDGTQCKINVEIY